MFYKFYVVICCFLLLVETFSLRVEQIDVCCKNNKHVSLYNRQSFCLRIMATLRNRRKLAAVSRETQENIRNNQSKNTLNSEMAEEYITRVSGEIEWSITEKIFQEFSRTESRILGALSKLDEFLLNPQVRTCFVAVPVTSRNNNSENREPTGDPFLNDLCPEVVFSACHTSNLNDSELEETHHRYFCWSSIALHWLISYDIPCSGFVIAYLRH